jgi:hypothetical protein
MRIDVSLADGVLDYVTRDRLPLMLLKVSDIIKHHKATVASPFWLCVGAK